MIAFLSVPVNFASPRAREIFGDIDRFLFM
jgi:hypothetical protein